MGVEIPSLRLSSRFFATRLDAKVLQVRPMGTTNWSISRDRSPALIAKIEHCWAPILSDFRGFYQLSDSRMELIMSKIPGQASANGHSSLGFQSTNGLQWISTAWGIICPILQDEAHRLLLGLPVPHQTVRDLAMDHTASRHKVTKPAPKITQFFSMDTTVFGVTTGDQVEVAQDGDENMQEKIEHQGQAGPLDKPTVARLEEHRRVSRLHGQS